MHVNIIKHVAAPAVELYIYGWFEPVFTIKLLMGSGMRAVPVLLV